jgi:hypothetical protein
MTQRPALAQTNIQWLARFGYAAREVVYLLAGIFSFLASITGSGDSVGPKGALGKAFELPFGGAIVYALAAGLVCFAGCRAVQAVNDPDRFICGPWRVEYSYMAGARSCIWG